MNVTERQLTADEIKLAEVKGRIAARRTEREAKVESRKIADELAEAERVDAIEAALVEAEATHGPLNRIVAVVHAKLADGTIAGSVIVKRPNHQIWKRFTHADLDNAKTGAEEADRLLRHCLVWPALDAYERLVEELPATKRAAITVISKLAGTCAEEVAGK